MNTTATLILIAACSGLGAALSGLPPRRIAVVVALLTIAVVAARYV